MSIEHARTIRELKILEAIVKERRRQDQKWGPQNHEDAFWFQILMEEVGEAAKASLNREKAETREELIQVAAVAIAFVEAIDRRSTCFCRKTFRGFHPCCQYHGEGRGGVDGVGDNLNMSNPDSARGGQVPR